MPNNGQTHDHLGHSHGGDGPPWFQRLLFFLGLAVTIMIIVVAIGVKFRWFR